MNTLNIYNLKSSITYWNLHLAKKTPNMIQTMIS